MRYCVDSPERELPPLSVWLLLLTLFCPAVDDGAALVAEFRVYYTRDRTEGERREAVLTLKGIDSVAAASVLLPALEDEDYAVRRAAVEVLGAIKLEAAATMLVQTVLEDRKASKNELLVAGVAEVLGAMGHVSQRPALEGLANDRRLSVRLGAIAGLGALGDAAATPTLSAQMGNPETAVNIAALDALGRLDAGEAAGPAVGAGLAYADKSVRLAGVRAAVALRLKSSLRPLMLMLDNELDPRVAEDAYEALLLLTQRKFPEETPAWLTWWDRTESRFEMPDLAALAAAKAAMAASGGRYSKGKTSFQGIETKSENIVFVVDVSKSMEQAFADPERLAATGREYSSLQRLAIVKEELINTIDALTETTMFNIVAFASDVETWKKRPVSASILNRNNAKTWVSRLQPKGGGGAAFRAQLGFSAAEANEGQTNTFLALMTAFDEDPSDKGANALVTRSKSPVDTIFFLTDGEPTVGETVDMIEIRGEVRRVNAYRGVQLHVIYVGAYGGNDFQRLAEENHGVFVAVGG